MQTQLRTRSLLFVGFLAEKDESGTFRKEVFTSNTLPNEQTHSRYFAIMGPFMTLSGARIAQERAGIGRGEVSSVHEAEYLAARRN